MMVTTGRDGSVKLWTLRPRGDDTWQFRGPSLESTEKTMTEKDAKGEEEEDASEHRPAEAMDVDPDRKRSEHHPSGHLSCTFTEAL